MAAVTLKIIRNIGDYNMGSINQGGNYLIIFND